MQFRNFTAVDRRGNVIAGAAVNVYEVNTTTPVSVFDEDGGALTQPLATNANGRIGFAAANGDYDVVFVRGGNTFTLENEHFSDAALAEANAAASAAAAAASAASAETDSGEAALSAAAARASELGAESARDQTQSLRNEAVAAGDSALWVSGTTYAIGDAAVSPTNFRTYRDTVGGVSNTDPAADTARWTVLEIDTLAGISAALGVTAVAFHIDTSPNPPLAVQAATSWFEESGPLPSTKIVVAEAQRITIHDGDDPTFPVWRVISPSSLPSFGDVWRTGRWPSSVRMLNGVFVFGQGSAGTSNGIGLSFYDFGADVAGVYAASAGQTGTVSPITSAETVQITPGLATIANNTVNDVVMTVLPDAPAHPVSGLQVPTICASHDAGTSVISPDGSIKEITRSGGHSWNTIYDGDKLMMRRASGGVDIFVHQLPLEADTNDFNNETLHLGQVAGALQIPSWNSVAASGKAVGTTSGLILFESDHTATDDGMACFVTDESITGWMVGDSKLTCLGENDTSDLVGGTLSDRSVNGNDLNVTGTIAMDPVATGAELVAASGFSATDYLEQPYNADLEAGAGDLDVVIWAYPTTSFDGMICYGDGAVDGTGWYLRTETQPEDLNFRTGAGSYTATGALVANAWNLVCVSRLGGVLTLFANGRVVGVFSDGATLSVGTSATLRIGNLGNSSAAAAGTDVFAGSLTLARVGLTGLTPEQVQLMYQEEKVLFQPSAQFSLANAAVSDVDFDDMTGLLHVANGSAHDTYAGLRRISTDPTARSIIHANNQLVLKQ